MIDDELDDLLRREAQSYNLPPEPPHEAMWERIERARAATPVVAIGSVRHPSWLRTSAGIAAVLLLGISIGRFTRGGVGPDTAAVGTMASAGSDTSSGRASDADVAARPGEETAPDEQTFGGGAADSGSPVRVATRRESRRVAESWTDRPNRAADYSVPARVRGAVGDGSEMSAYRLAVVEHMARTEVLLTNFRVQARHDESAARADAQLATLSRELLTTTRLLLATRSSEDPVLTRLLEDLELVLMQISQYTADGRKGDLDAINQSLDRRNVLPKLRSTIPAGVSASTGIQQ